MVQITLDIDGMQCSMCEAHVNDIIRKNFGVKKVKSSHSKNRSVIISKEDIPDEEIKKALQSMGYKLLGSQREPYNKKTLFGR